MVAREQFDFLATLKARIGTFQTKAQAKKEARLDATDEKAAERARRKSQRQSELLERRLQLTLSRDLNVAERAIAERLMMLGFVHSTTNAKGKKVINKLRWVQDVATPTTLYVRVDTLRMPYGKHINIEELQESYVLQSLSAAVQKPVRVHYEPEHGFWFVIERAPKPAMQEFVDVLLMMPTSTGPTDVPLGVDANRRLKHEEIVKMPHLLIAGATGYGKSIYMHGLLCTLIQRARPDRVKLTLVDLAGGVELGVYGGVPHLFGETFTPDEVTGAAVMPVDEDAAGDDDFTPEQWAALAEDTGAPLDIEPRIYTEPEEVGPLLRRVRAEVQRRMKLFVKEGVRNLDGWNFKHRKIGRLPNWIVVIDELQNVMLDKALREDAESLLAKIAAVSRKTGISLVIATQRPSTDVITGLIKANFPARVAFNVASMHDSMTILGNGDAANLGRPGLMIYQRGTDYYTCQAPFLSEALVGDIIERVKTGAPSITELTHSVGKLDMVRWAIAENDGEFDIDEVYFVFKPRGVTHRDVRECALAFIGQVVDVDGKFYRLERPLTGAARFVEAGGEV